MPQALAWLQVIDPREASPVLLAANAVLGLVILAIIAVGCAGWTLACTRLLSGQRILSYEPRRDVPWGLIDLIAVIVLLLLTTILAQGVLIYGGLVPMPKVGVAGEPSVWLLAADAVTKFVSLAAVAYFIYLRHPLSWEDLGFRGDRLLTDLRTGLVAFCMLAPVVFGIQFLLVQWWPSSHPLIEMLQRAPSPWMFAFTCFSAVIVAPLSEELAFRVLLQGWLERAIRDPHQKIEHLLLGGAADAQIPVTEVPSDIVDAKLQADEEIWVNQSDNPYATPATIEVAAPYEPSFPVHTKPGPLWYFPIGASSAIFALLHYSHGPDWVPLTFLGLGLGYLYQRTHRATPSIVVHFLLNGLSMIGVGLQVFLLPDAK
jgi:membrane protease YdiL (CAAX protease family)